ncbi:MAG: hypothetical protein FJZ97_13480, partial [Chloroflexi bacterium]|nr:hypothetical protein [Chloroflexota bacterium]
MSLADQLVLKGVVVPCLTPCNADGSIDYGGLKSNVQRAVEDGIITGKGVLLIAAGGGELPFLTPEQRSRCLQSAVEAAAGKAQV